MKKTFKVIIISFMLNILLGGMAFAAQDSHIKPYLFINWLKSHEKELGNCHPRLEKKNIILCDNTTFALKEIKELLALSPEKIVLFIKSKKINLKIICSSKDGDFKKYCIKEDKLNKKETMEFKNITKIHGQYKPLINTIFMQSHSSVGTLVHEYLHYLQYQNLNKTFGKRYKKDRIEIQKELIKRMDQIIISVKEKEVNKDKNGIKELVNEMLKLSTLLKSFSKWQDLIDERSIFEFFIIFEKELILKKTDLELAIKNMKHICLRKDLKKSLDRKYCFLKKTSSFRGDYYEGIKDLIKLVRPNPNYKLLDQFLKGLPDIKKHERFELKIKKISDYIFKTMKMGADTTYLSRNNKDNILPDSTLKYKKGHCVGLSTLYLLAFEQYFIDAGLVRLPSHVFVRACEKKKCLNIETLKQGKIVKDDFYINEGLISKELFNHIEKTSYYKKLNKFKDLASSIYLSLGFIASTNSNWPLAELFYKKSIDNSRGFAEGYSNLSGVYNKMGRATQMRMYLNIGHKINPYHPATNLNLGILEFEKKDFKKSREFYNKAMRFRPNFFEAYIKSAELYSFLGQDREALYEYKKSLLVNPKSCSSMKKILTYDISISYKEKITKKLQNLKAKKYCN